VQNLCGSAIWLQHGQIRQKGPSKTVSEAYLQYTLQEVYGNEVKLISTKAESKTLNEQTDSSNSAKSPIFEYQPQATVTNNLTRANGWKTGVAEITDVRLSHIEPGLENVFLGGERVRMTIRARAYQDLKRPILGFLVRDRLGQDLFGENTLPFTNLNPRPVQAGQEITGVFTFRLPMLANGQYAVMTSVADGDLHSNVQHQWLHDAMIINVSSSKVRYGLVGVVFEDVSLNYFQ
jgi:lipopolysaccharide transport system ATP-binding protein